VVFLGCYLRHLAYGDLTANRSEAVGRRVQLWAVCAEKFWRGPKVAGQLPRFHWAKPVGDRQTSAAMSSGYRALG
jgi:hypothetical protein